MIIKLTFDCTRIIRLGFHKLSHKWNFFDNLFPFLQKQKTMKSTVSLRKPKLKISHAALEEATGGVL